METRLDADLVLALLVSIRVTLYVTRGPCQDFEGKRLFHVADTRLFISDG
jgi:hypothetical protein